MPKENLDRLLMNKWVEDYIQKDRKYYIISNKKRKNFNFLLVKILI
jgi:hypothetical protein